MDKEEKEILDSVERGEWRKIPNFKKEVKRYRGYAKATLKRNALTRKTLNKSDKGQDIESFGSLDEMFENWEK